ncbi:hypothetical protein SAMN05660199_03249 [Klenkia soli]|uniref:Uncharacterized protein n=1 Tax=Klenkia soli TaxID=1052260 RepID=A0A1H0Q946_9ACTN|nr:hypothetical protein [Klenkia soli]SDP13565.1 hypothetical protein SAMN05660199_03249 [Klenkia soli]
MHPTVDEQLTGALRLLDVLETEDELSTGGQEVLTNVRRLLGKVQRSWAAQLPFHTTDNAELTTLLNRTAPLVDPGLVPEDDATPPLDAVAVATRNAELRALLSRVVTGLPRTPEGDAARAEIGDHLRHRVDTDPT